MNIVLPYRKNLLFTTAALLILMSSVVYSQQSHRVLKHQVSFSKLAADAGMVYTYPAGFKEIEPVYSADFPFDYALTMPGEDFEIWFHATSSKSHQHKYERAPAKQGQLSVNPDSAYLEAGKTKAAQLSVDGTYFERNLTAHTLAAYNADAGKTYLVNLSDSPQTRHYSYALIITLQKNHVGNLLVVCLTNDRGPEFFKNINRLRSCIRFK